MIRSDPPGEGALIEAPWYAEFCHFLTFLSDFFGSTALLTDDVERRIRCRLTRNRKGAGRPGSTKMNELEFIRAYMALTRCEEALARSVFIFWSAVDAESVHGRLAHLAGGAGELAGPRHAVQEGP